MAFSPQLILLDGSAFLFRAYFSTLAQNLSNDEGFPTGAIFGVINSIKYLQRQYPQAKMIAIFDTKGKNHRHALYPEYKAHRKPAEADLIKQIEPLYEIVRALGFHFICMPGVEADDVIATISKKANSKNISVMIASNDKDLFQLVNNTTCQIDMKGNVLDAAAVEAKMGVRPEKMLDFLSLTGDSADNIPGVPSVGAKTAVKWLQTYGDIANIKANAANIKGKVGEKLQNNFDLLSLSRQLVELKFNLDLPCDFTSEQPGQDSAKLASLYQKYGFTMWLKQLENESETTIKTVAKPSNESNILTAFQQILLLNEAPFNTFIERLKNSKTFVFDLETTGLNYYQSTIVGFVFLLEKDSFYLPVGHDYLDAPKQLAIKTVLAALKPILADKNITKVGQNLKYDAHILMNYKVELCGISDDTMLKSYCLDSVATHHNMDDLALHYLQHKTIRFADVAGSGKKQIMFNQVHLDAAVPYACEDVIITFLLNTALQAKIAPTPMLLKLYQTLELPLIKVLMKMERNGVKLDQKSLQTQQSDVLAQMQDLQTQAFKAAGETFNLESPKQIAQILFSAEGLGLKAKKKTPKGQPSTNEEALKLLKEDHPLVGLILNYRTLTKLNSTYLEALPKQINPITKRLHTSYHQAVTATGRLSSSNPNLQNIPIRTEQGARIRSAFIAGKNKLIIAADYSQIELRIMAHIAKDKNLLHAFNNNIDVHKVTASQMFDLPLDKVGKNERRNAKAINFGLIYGMSAFGLAKQINVSKTKAKHYIDAYFDKYPGVKDYINKTKQTAKINGFVETINGRRLYLPQINSSNKIRQQHALRTAINAPMQGSSADIIKQAMLDIDAWIGENNTDILMIMQVHDELVFEVNADKVDEFSSKIKQLMENTATLTVPLLVSIGVGKNWQQAH